MVMSSVNQSAAGVRHDGVKGSSVYGLLGVSSGPSGNPTQFICEKAGPVFQQENVFSLGNHENKKHLDIAITN